MLILMTTRSRPGRQTSALNGRSAAGPGTAFRRQVEFSPSERISLADAIKGYTLNAAFAGHREKSEGSLESGKVADLVVISQDLFKVDPLKITETKVLLTMVAGRVVYKAENF